MQLLDPIDILLYYMNKFEKKKKFYRRLIGR